VSHTFIAIIKRTSKLTGKRDMTTKSQHIYFWANEYDHRKSACLLRADGYDHKKSVHILLAK
jgi:hypothetical protein